MLEGHEKDISSATFSPNGELIITSSFDDTARIWNAKTGEQNTLLEHGQNVNYAEFSPDGQRVVTASDDGAVRLWDVDRGIQLLTFKTDEEYVNRAIFSSDGKYIVADSSIWHIFPTTQALIDYANQIVPRQLDCEERRRFDLGNTSKCEN